MSEELELKPWLLKSGKISDSDDWVLEAFLAVNPRLEKELKNNNLDIGDVCTVVRVYQNPSQTNCFKYNTIAEIQTDGCHLSNKDSGPVLILFSYGRVDLAFPGFSSTETVGTPDIPFLVKENTEAGIKAAYFNLVNDVKFLEDVAGKEGVKKWKVILNPDNRAAIFTKWVNKTRKYYNEFIVYTKQDKTNCSALPPEYNLVYRRVVEDFGDDPVNQILYESPGGIFKAQITEELNANLLEISSTGNLIHKGQDIEINFKNPDAAVLKIKTTSGIECNRPITDLIPKYRGPNAIDSLKTLTSQSSASVNVSFVKQEVRLNERTFQDELATLTAQSSSSVNIAITSSGQ